MEEPCFDVLRTQEQLGLHALFGSDCKFTDILCTTYVATLPFVLVGIHAVLWVCLLRFAHKLQNSGEHIL